jgi:hypothetical protein
MPFYKPITPELQRFSDEALIDRNKEYLSIAG